MKRSVRPTVDSTISVVSWKYYSMYVILGAFNSKALDDLCGALIVTVGISAGIFHLASRVYAPCAASDNLIATGWRVVG
jgi:uncharacterized membrane protein (DUF485 family)